MKLQSTLVALVCSALAGGDALAQTVALESQAPSPPAVPAAADSARVVLLPLSRGLLADVVAGGAGAGGWGVTVQGGYAWSALRGYYGVGHRLALLADVETALAVRWRPALGLSAKWVDTARVRISGDVLLGWLFQSGSLPKRGPSGELRIRAAVLLGRVAPYLVLATKHSILPDRTVLQKADSTQITWTARHEWMPWGTLGVGIALTPRLGLDVGVDYGWVDAPQSVAIPGFHLGLYFGGASGSRCGASCGS